MSGRFARHACVYDRVRFHVGIPFSVMMRSSRRTEFDPPVNATHK
jgi:hypothetical protein